MYFRQCQSIERSSAKMVDKNNETESKGNVEEAKKSETTHQTKENGIKVIENNEDMEDRGTEMFSCLICGKEFKLVAFNILELLHSYMIMP